MMSLILFQTPLDGSKTHNCRTTQSAIWGPLTKRTDSFSRLPQGSEGEKSFLSVPVSSLKLSQNVQSAGSLWEDFSPLECQASLDTWVAPGHPCRLPVMWIIFPGNKKHSLSRARSMKKLTDWGFPLWITFSIKKRHYVDSWKIVPWTEILFVMIAEYARQQILLQKTREPGLKICSF